MVSCGMQSGLPAGFQEAKSTDSHIQGLGLYTLKCNEDFQA